MTDSDFSDKLMNWHKDQHRPMPWKGTKNPYWVWLSEIILQQTRVEQGLPYFNKFIALYPTVKDLADAPEDDVMKTWQGLGYYSRARNLHATAKRIAYEMNGKFPDTYAKILKLKGVGPYTAAAIASFAFDLPHAVVDGNVYRVLARVFGIHTPIDSTEEKEFNALANLLIDKSKPAAYNQAIMDFGATLCTPKSPNCNHCPFNETCVALAHNEVLKLPVKSKKMIQKERFFNYLVIYYQDKTYIQKRTEKDIWQNLYEFPMIEMANSVELDVLKQTSAWQQLFANETGWLIKKISPPMRQTLTHRKIIARFITIELNNAINAHPFVEIEKNKLSNFAFPKIITRFLTDNSLYLDLI